MLQAALVFLSCSLITPAPPTGWPGRTDRERIRETRRALRLNWTDSPSTWSSAGCHSLRRSPLTGRSAHVVNQTPPRPLPRPEAQCTSARLRTREVPRYLSLYPQAVRPQALFRLYGPGGLGANLTIRRVPHQSEKDYRRWWGSGTQRGHSHPQYQNYLYLPHLLLSS